MNTIHKLSYMVQIHGWNLKNVQVDCRAIIEDAEILQVPLRKNKGVAEDQTICEECTKIDPQRRMKRIYLRERLKEDGS